MHYVAIAFGTINVSIRFLWFLRFNQKYHSGDHHNLALDMIAFAERSHMQANPFVEVLQQM